MPKIAAFDGFVLFDERHRDRHQPQLALEVWDGGGAACPQDDLVADGDPARLLEARGEVGGRRQAGRNDDAWRLASDGQALGRRVRRARASRRPTSAGSGMVEGRSPTRPVEQRRAEVGRRGAGRARQLDEARLGPLDAFATRRGSVGPAPHVLWSLRARAVGGRWIGGGWVGGGLPSPTGSVTDASHG